MRNRVRVRVRVRIRVRDRVRDRVRVRVRVRLFSPLRHLRCATCVAPNTESPRLALPSDCKKLRKGATYGSEILNADPRRNIVGDGLGLWVLHR